MRPVVAAIAAALVLGAGCTAVEEDPTTSTGVVTTIAPVASTPAPTTTPGADLAAVAVTTEEIATLDEPTAMTTRSGDPGLYLTERAGRVRRIDVTTRRGGGPGYELESTPVLDLTDDVLADGQEQGLLGIAFSTDGSKLYVAYTGSDEDQHLDEFAMNGDRATAGSRREILVVGDFAPNHNGGQVAFGPDGYLYWAMGDGGGAGDPRLTGQDPSDHLGSLLRIDPDVGSEATSPYAIPNGNPFAGGDGAPEVWAYGLRNPWRFSFDRATGDLWIADVGQGSIEEIDLLPADATGTNAGRGANLGWSVLEGTEPFGAGSAPDDPVAPVFTYTHDEGGCSVTGGHVYRGTAVPALVGAYVYADFCIGDVRALVVRDGDVTQEQSLGIDVDSPSSFGVDNAGELYVLSLDGAVHRVVAA